MFFDSWYGILRILVCGTLAYVATISALRISGNRALSKMNAFDMVITVALGSTLSAVLLDKRIPLAEGVAGLGLLLCLQRILAWVSLRWPRWQWLLKNQPRLLVFRGEMLKEAMRQERIVPEELHAAARAHGFAALEDVHAIILETRGTLSVLAETAAGERFESLEPVPGYPSG